MNPESQPSPSATAAGGALWSETLRDGSRLTIRAISPQDATAERAFIEGLSDQARRFRFLGQTRRPSEEFVRKLTDIDYVHDYALVAETVGDDRRIVGVSRCGSGQGGSSCECAVAVTDEWQNKGLGTMLMDHLMQVARDRGIRSMYSIDSAENARMRALAGDLGFRTRSDPDDASQVIHELNL